MKKTKHGEELAKAKKAEDEEEEEEEQEPGEGSEEEEEDMQESKRAKKSEDLTQDDLQKSLERLEGMASDGDRVSRKQALLEKAQSEELDEDEQKELFQLLGKSETGVSTLVDEVTKGMDENEDLQKALDVSEYLQENQSELKKSLGVLAEHIEKSDARQHEFNLILAKAVSDIGKHVVGMSERLGIVERQPARAPKSRGAQPLEKGFAGQQPVGEQLSKSQVLEALGEMVEESVSKGMSGALEDGTDLVLAASKYEQFSAINPGLLNRVREHIKSKGATAH